MATADRGMGFLADPAPTAENRRLHQQDLDGGGYVMNLSRLWSYQPATIDALRDLLDEVARGGSLSFRQRAILIAACASTLGDAYCSLAWGTKLAGVAEDDTAGAVLRGDDAGLEPEERALARWARQVARDPNAVEPGDVAALRDAGFDDAQIFAITVFVALRIAFSAVNDALGARPDRELGRSAPRAVRDAVTFGRPVATDDA
jgi:uncharacterized peroxidase-related enzyme